MLLWLSLSALVRCHLLPQQAAVFSEKALKNQQQKDTITDWLVNMSGERVTYFPQEFVGSRTEAKSRVNIRLQRGAQT